MQYLTRILRAESGLRWRHWRVRSHRTLLPVEGLVRSAGDGKSAKHDSHRRIGVLWIRDKMDWVTRPDVVRSEKVEKLNALLADLASPAVE